MPAMPNALRTAFLGLALVAALVAGCQSEESDPFAVYDESGEVDVFQKPPKVTADTYFAAGQVHELGVAQRASATGGQGALDAQRQARLARARAVEQYEKALAIDAAHVPSLFRLAVIQTEEGELEQATALWQRYVRATDGAAAGWTNLAICQEAAEDRNGAEASYRHAVSVDPKHEVARVNLGMLLARDGRLQEAASQLSVALDPAAVHWHLAHALASRGDQSAADRHFRAAANLDPQYQRNATPQASIR